MKIKVYKSEENMKKIISLFLALVIICASVTSCENVSKSNTMGTGASRYLETRDTTGRDITYVEFCVENYGRFVLLIDATSAPITARNFIELVKAGFYDGKTFHRIIKGFMIQGGDPNADGTGGLTETIYGEFSSNGYYGNDLSHIRGVISMARSDSPDSASCQFFICNARAKALDGNYAAFGYVVEGMSVIDEITETVFPKTYLADFYGNTTVHPDYSAYNITYHDIWEYYGNGALENDADKPVIKYAKVLHSWTAPSGN